MKRALFLIIGFLVLPSFVTGRWFYLEWLYRGGEEIYSRGLRGRGYKDVKYNLKSGNDYEKETAEAKLSYERKKNWQASAGLEQNFYDFDDSSNDKKRTYVKLSGEKLFFEGDLVLSMDFKYRYTDYKQGNDKDQEAIRLAFKYRF
jgi:hypothetical protein